MAHLFESFTQRGLTFRNRVGMSPMCQYSSVDGHATDWHLTHMGARAIGGCGLLIAEATAVEARGRITPRDAGLWNDEQIEPLVRVNAFAKSMGARVGVQLAHAGRKASTPHPWSSAPRGTLAPSDGGWQPIGPDDRAFTPAYASPRAMTLAEIEQVREAFVSAALRAIASGYDFIEIHGAHGYLLHSFVSPLSNARTDAYGGSFEGRTRLLREVVQKVRAVMPDAMPLWVRLSSSDQVEGGWSVENSVELARGLKALGVDLIDCSSGGAVAATGTVKTAQAPGFQVPLASQVRREAGISTAAVGYITEATQADAIVRDGHADVVLLGRELLRNPFWAVHAAKALGHVEAARWPDAISYWVG